MHDADILVARGQLNVRAVTDSSGGREAIAWLDEAERRVGGPLVDEAERQRLQAFAAGEAATATEWRGMVARRGTSPVGYAGVVLTPDADGDATGDAAFHHDGEETGDVLGALLAGLDRLAERHAVARLVVWIRHVEPDDHARAGEEGFQVERRLGVLGRSLTPMSDAAVDVGANEHAVAHEHAGTDRHAGADEDAGAGDHEGTDGRDGTDGHAGAGQHAGAAGHAGAANRVPAIRSYCPDADDDAVVELLAAAYRGTDEAGWDHQQFRERRELAWFRPEDLLIAEDGRGRTVGVVWLKRRGDGVGEIYNLAIHPDAQGAGIGGQLLVTALGHLQRSCAEAILWVDLANVRAVRLYRSHGFETRWEDVALVHHLGGTLDAPSH